MKKRLRESDKDSQLYAQIKQTRFELMVKTIWKALVKTDLTENVVERPVQFALVCAKPSRTNNQQYLSGIL